MKLTDWIIKLKNTSCIPFYHSSEWGVLLTLLYLVALPTNAIESTSSPTEKPKPVVLAIVDDGFRTTHSSLSSFIWTNPKEIPNNKIDDDLNGYIDDVHGWDISDNDGNVNPPEGRPEYYHGTHVAGIVSELFTHKHANTSHQYLHILPVKTLEDRAENFYLKDAFAGLEYAIDSGADIILTAWGVEHVTPHQKDILAKADKQGVLIIAAAGNFPTEKKQFPAAYPSVIAVSALSIHGQKLEGANYAPFVDIVTIGESITAAGIDSDDATITKSGTSSAAAIVAATAVLIKTKHPSFSAQEIKACLVSSAQIIQTQEDHVYGKLGAGALNIKKSIECPLLFNGTPEQQTLLGSKGYIYPPNSRTSLQQWEVTPQGKLNGIKFNISHLNDPDGTLAFLTLPTRQMIAQYSVSDVPKDLYLQHPQLLVRYQPSNKIEKPWRLEYQAIHKDTRTEFCSGTSYVTEPSTITDGSQGRPYSYNTSCKWQITAPKGKVVQIDFSELNTESRHDMVYLFSGKKTNAPIMAIFSGTELPPSLTSWTNEVLMWFVANDRTQGQGWQANILFVDPPANQ